MTSWRVSLEADIEAIQGRIKALNAELQKKRQQQELLVRLIESTVQDSSPSEIVNQALEPPVASPPQTHQAPATDTHGEINEHVFQILSEVKGPMNIKDIHAEFIRRGFPIPGKGTPFNILIHLSRALKRKAGRFQRTARGTYALRGRVSQPKISVEGNDPE